jgi:hypothetical protein
MKNKKLRDLIAQKKDVTQPNAAEVSVLNGDQLAQLLGGSSLTECPNLKTCGTFADCNGKCVVLA